MNYKLNLGCWGSVFAVPTALVDDFIVVSSGENIKILLFLLRNSEKGFSAEEMAKQLSLSVNQVEDGIAYWCQRGILAENEGELSPAQGNVEKPVNMSSVRKTELRRIPDFTPKEIAGTVRGNDKAGLLFTYCEKMYGRALKHNEQNTLMVILEDAGMPVEVAMLMLEYCFWAGKTTPAYMRTLALDWMEREINTIERAEAQILELKNLNSAENRFRKMFSVTSAFSKAQREYIDVWVNKYCFSDDMINEAYQLTLNNTGKLAFPYMNKLLSSWHDKGYTTPEQLSAVKEKEQKSDRSSSFDISEIEQLAAKKYGD